MSRATVEAALFFLARGWVPVRVQPRDKAPAAVRGWQLLRPTVDEITRWPACNVGVLLGSASGGLTDIDLDCSQAVELAPYYLPVTWVFGRSGKPDSHWLYQCRPCGQSCAFTYGEGKGKVTMLEIRADTARGPGHQTVFPPSTHKSGEAIEWSPEHADGTDGPRVIEWRELLTAVCHLARGTVAMLDGATVEEAREFVRTYKPEPITAQRASTPGRDRRANVVKRARNYVATMPPAVSGSGGHDATYAVALVLVKGFELDDATALEIMHEYSERSSPPWSEAELAHKIAAARTAARVPSGYLLDVDRRRA